MRISFTDLTEGKGEAGGEGGGANWTSLALVGPSLAPFPAALRAIPAGGEWGERKADRGTKAREGEGGKVHGEKGIRWTHVEIRCIRFVFPGWSRNSIIFGMEIVFYKLSNFKASPLREFSQDKINS